MGVRASGVLKSISMFIVFMFVLSMVGASNAATQAASAKSKTDVGALAVSQVAVPSERALDPVEKETVANVRRDPSSAAAPGLQQDHSPALGGGVSNDVSERVQSSIKANNQPVKAQPVATPVPPVKPKKVVYLTFDDGPSLFTPQILDILAKKQVKATFFMIDGNIRNYQSTTKRMIKEGNYPGLHSVSHNQKKLYKTNSTNFANEMVQTQATLKKITGFNSTLIRAPYGSSYLTKGMRDYTYKKGFKMWDWTIDSRDWALANNPSQILTNVKKRSGKPQEVLLLHERKQTVKMLPAIIDLYKKDGYEFRIYDPKQHFMVNFHNDKRL